MIRPAVWAASALAVAAAAHAAMNRRNLRHLSPGSAGPVTGRVSVMVPARDEEDHIGGCLTALLAQRDVVDLEIIVLDDDSGDATARAARSAAGSDPRVRVLSSTLAPPPGWLGKPYACHRLSQEANGDVLVFVDADVRLHPDAIATACADLSATGCQLLSAWPRQLATTHLARMVQPLQQWSWLTTLPLRIAADSPRGSMAAANGQFLLFSRAGYDRIGGHTCVADQVLEDIALARAVKRAGLRAELVDASQVAECLMYDSDAALLAGYTKSLWGAFGRPATSVLVTGALAATYALPIGYAVAGRHTPTRLVASMGYVAAVVNRMIAARETGSPPWPAAAEHPAALVALFVLTLESVRRHRRHTLEWRGRSVTPAPKVAGDT